LHRAAKSGYKAVVKLLLDREATIDAEDREGGTPLLDWEATIDAED